MTSTDQHKSGDKSGRRKQKRNKKAQPNPEAVRSKAEPAIKVRESVTDVAAEPAAEAAPRAEPAVRPAAAHPLAVTVEAAKTATQAGDRVSAPMPAKAAASSMAPSPESPLAGVQAIARAYREYTAKSLENAQSFAAKLTSARSLDKAIEAQTEFARMACENFANDSRKIRELHRDLFWQAFNVRKSPRST